MTTETTFTPTSMSVRRYNNASEPHVTFSFADQSGNKIVVPVPNEVFEGAARGLVEAEIENMTANFTQAYQNLIADLKSGVSEIEDTVKVFGKETQRTMHIKMQRAKNRTLDVDTDVAVEAVVN